MNCCCFNYIQVSVFRKCRCLPLVRIKDVFLFCFLGCLFHFSVSIFCFNSLTLSWLSLASFTKSPLWNSVLLKSNGFFCFYFCSALSLCNQQRGVPLPATQKPVGKFALFWMPAMVGWGEGEAFIDRGGGRNCTVWSNSSWNWWSVV